MLKNLLKYDLKWIYKLVIFFYILAFIFSVIGRGLSTIENSTIFTIASQFSYGLAIAMMINALINNLMRLWVRFSRNIYKDESYLTHTLPVNKNKIYLSKCLAGLITIFTTILVILVCLAICFYSPSNIEGLKSILEITANIYNSTVIEIILLFFSVLFLQMLFALLAGYVGIVLGHKSNDKKMLKSIVYGIGLYFIAQIATLLIIFIIGLFNPDIMNLFLSSEISNMGAIKTIMVSIIIVYAVYIAGYYLLGKRQIEKGVNIE